ncbi:MAG: LCP family protein [Faecalibacterium sp.]
MRPRTARSPFPTARPTPPPTIRSTRWPSPTAASIAALAEVIYDQYKLPIDYYVTVDMQALVEMVDNFGGIEVYIPHDMSFAAASCPRSRATAI